MSTLLKEQLSAHGAYPELLAAQYPKLMDQMATHWRRGTFEAYVTGLLFDGRGHRVGFCSEIIEELMVLQKYCLKRQLAKPLSIGTWSDHAI